MWLLMILFLSPAHHTFTVLGHYQTEHECQAMRNEIGFNMAEAYPQAEDFVIVCQYRPRVI